MGPPTVPVALLPSAVVPARAAPPASPAAPSSTVLSASTLQPSSTGTSARAAPPQPLDIRSLLHPAEHSRLMVALSASAIVFGIAAMGVYAASGWADLAIFAGVLTGLGVLIWLGLQIYRSCLLGGIGKLYPHAGPLLSARWNEDLVADCWSDLLRMAGSLKYGQATASLIVGKWSASSRQNTLAAALKEWGTLRRTIHAAKYLSDPAYRRKIARQLNKGESLHALRRDLHYAQQGTIGKPLLTDQTEQAWCLTVLTNAVITWTTEYYQLAVQDLRAKGRAVPGELLAHISPAHSENVNFFGVITVDVEAELAKLDTGGWRPLRPIAPDPGLFP